jgi:hypothetical protein
MSTTAKTFEKMSIYRQQKKAKKHKKKQTTNIFFYKFIYKYIKKLSIIKLKFSMNFLI